MAARSSVDLSLAVLPRGKPAPCLGSNAVGGHRLVPQVLGKLDLLARVVAEGRNSLGKFDTPGSENGETRVGPFGLEGASSLSSMFSVAPGLHSCCVSPFALDS